MKFDKQTAKRIRKARIKREQQQIAAAAKRKRWSMFKSKEEAKPAEPQKPLTAWL